MATDLGLPSGWMSAAAQAVDIAERMHGGESVMLNEPRESLLLLAESVLARVGASNDR